MPTTRHGFIRRLLQHNQATVIRDLPFTIHLHNTQSTNTQPLILAIDPGYTIGAAIVTPDGTPVFLGEFKTRSDEIPDLMKQRAASRRMRRQHRRDKRKRRAQQAETTFEEERKFWLHGKNNMGEPYDPLTCKGIKPKVARFNNRKRDDKWLVPTARHLLYSHIRIVNYLCALLPITQIVVEYAQFDIQKINNPDIHGEEYQQGRMLGSENVNQYVLERDRHLCQLCLCDTCFRRLQQYNKAVFRQDTQHISFKLCSQCKKKTVNAKLHVHHVIWKEKGGADTPENLVTLCHECHELVHQYPATNQRLQEKFHGIKKRYVHTTLLNTILPFFYRWLQFSDIPVSKTFGYITKYYRKEWKLNKSHALDAYVIAIKQANVTPKTDHTVPVFDFMQFRRHKRNLVSRIEDRKYYTRSDGKLICVAKNKGNGRTGQTDKPSLKAYREQYGEHAISQLSVGSRGKGKKAICDKTVPWNPGDVVRYHGQRKVLKGTRSKGKELGFVGEKDYVKAKDCQLLYKNSGLVCIGTRE